LQDRQRAACWGPQPLPPLLLLVVLLVLLLLLALLVLVLVLLPQAQPLHSQQLLEGLERVLQLQLQLE
jgi:hypothetical protein